MRIPWKTAILTSFLLFSVGTALNERQALAASLLDVTGDLVDGDTVAQDGSLFDTYTFTGEVGQQVAIALESQDFDTYLLILDANQAVIDANDDVSSGNTNSALNLTLPYTGTYTVIVNAYDSSGRGNYRLSVNAMTASTSPSTTNCTEAKVNAIRAIEQGRNISVREENFDLSEYADYPTDRPDEYALIMDGPATESILNSNQFMKTLATEIISTCDSVGAVVFALDNSGWGVTLGLFPDGSIDFFECIFPEQGSSDILPWGYKYCT